MRRRWGWEEDVVLVALGEDGVKERMWPRKKILHEGEDVAWRRCCLRVKMCMGRRQFFGEEMRLKKECGPKKTIH